MGFHKRICTSGLGWAGWPWGVGGIKKIYGWIREDFYNAKLWTMLLRRGRSSFNADGSGRMLWRQRQQTNDATLTYKITHSGLGA